MKTKTKKFDCVEMKRRGAEKVRRATEGLTREEELAFWSRGTAELVKEQKVLRQAKGHANPANPRRAQAES
ncbi:MAG: hypothetical protein V2A74_07485 [bacterium]